MSDSRCRSLRLPKLDHVVEHARRLSTSTTLDNAMNYICSSTCQLGLRKSCYLVCVKKHTPSACYNFFSRRSRGKFPFELCANVPMEEGTRARRASLAAPVTIATRSSVQAAWCRNTNMVRTNVQHTAGHPRCTQHRHVRTCLRPSPVAARRPCLGRRSWRQRCLEITLS